MTTFYLHGGKITTNTPKNKQFFSEIVANLKTPPKFLLVCFAQPKERWSQSLKKTSKTILDFIHPLPATFELADNNTELFIQQVNNSNIILLRGGNELLLKKHLTTVPHLSSLLKNKVVAGTSAGANIFSRYYYTNDRQKIETGLNILPIKTFCHYNETKKEQLNKLDNYKEKLELYPIAEENFFIINT